MLILLLVFILENTQSVNIDLLRRGCHLPLGVALLLAAIGGALLVGIVGLRESCSCAVASAAAPGLTLPQRAQSSSGTRSRSSASQVVAEPSLGARQSPRGDSDPPDPTFGAFGIAERLNWLVWKNRSRNTPSQCLISPSVYWWRRSNGIRSGHEPAERSLHA